jgi:hypothetical protein
MKKILKKVLKKEGAKTAAKPAKIKADKKYTSYDTSKEETSTPQKVREGNEPEGEQKRMKQAKKKNS